MVSSGDTHTNEKNCKGAKLGSTSECDVHGAGVLKQADPKKALGFFAKSQTKAHMLGDQLAPVVEEEEEEEEVFMERKGEELEDDYNI